MTAAPDVRVEGDVARRRLPAGVEWFHDHVRIEHLLPDGAPDAKGGAMVPDLTVPGHGITLASSAERYGGGDPAARWPG